MNETKELKHVREADVDHVLFRETDVAIDAALELLEDKLGSGNAVYKVIKERLEANLEKTKKDILDYLNKFIDRTNAARALIAGEGCDAKAERDEHGCLDLGQSFYPPEGFIRNIGIHRIAETKAFELEINDKTVEGTALPEDVAQRVYKALSKFYDEWQNEQRKKKSKQR